MPGDDELTVGLVAGVCGSPRRARGRRPLALRGPAQLVACTTTPHPIGCAYVLLDRDADDIADLPLWDW